jgi:hypothetical protein
VVDGVPVLASRSALASPAPGGQPAERPAVVPARQAAALAATSFVAGAAAVAVVGRRAPRWTSRRRRRRKGVLGEIISSNSFLVDVHLVRRG